MSFERRRRDVRRPSRWDRLSTGLKMWIILSRRPAAARHRRGDGLGRKCAGTTATRRRSRRRRLLAIHVAALHAGLVAQRRHACAPRATRCSIGADPSRDLRAHARPAGPAAQHAGALRALSERRRFRAACRPASSPPDPLADPQGQIGRAIIPPDGGVLDVFLYAPDGALEGRRRISRRGACAGGRHSRRSPAISRSSWSRASSVLHPAPAQRRRAARPRPSRASPMATIGCASAIARAADQRQRDPRHPCARC